MNDPDVKLLILIVLIAGLAGALWFFRDDVFPPVDEPVATVDNLPRNYLGEKIRPVGRLSTAFADAELEALSSGQKLLLRIGSEHAAKIKQTLTELRARIVQS